MEPEEIDKLFRDKLDGLPAMPSADTWMRLQQKMEPQKKERTRWIYYAAASVVVLLLAGILFFKNSAGPATPPIATAPRVTTPANVPPLPGPAEGVKPAPVSPEAKQELASQVAQVPVKKMVPAKVSISHPLPRLVIPEKEETGQVAVTAEPAPAVIPMAATPALTPAPTAPGAPDMEVVEVVVTRGPAGSNGEALSLRDNLNRKGHLLRNIYKQARNLKNGEPVELAALGVDKEKIQEETKELKQKITNVISL